MSDDTTPGAKRFLAWRYRENDKRLPVTLRPSVVSREDNYDELLEAVTAEDKYFISL